MDLAIDHLVVAARTLEEGAAWIEERLGVAPVAGGKHERMGTHNRLLRLGERVYLEVIAVDPDAPPPGRPRWFDLDSPALLERLRRSPELLHWVERSGDIEAAVKAAGEPLEVLDLSRGEFRWRIAVRADGRLPGGGRRPTLIQWKGEAHPCDRLPESGCRLLDLETSGTPLTATIGTPAGIRMLP